MYGKFGMDEDLTDDPFLDDDELAEDDDLDGDDGFDEDDGFGGSGSQWSMIPTIVRSLGYDLLPAASLAAELLTQITQSPGLAPTASTATFWLLPSRTT